jgi:hypothetical protein
MLKIHFSPKQSNAQYPAQYIMTVATKSIVYCTISDSGIYHYTLKTTHLQDERVLSQLKFIVVVWKI